ncbi:hypothetical protein [Rhodococcus erythropolis]
MLDRARFVDQTRPERFGTTAAGMILDLPAAAWINKPATETPAAHFAA